MRVVARGGGRGGEGAAAVVAAAAAVAETATVAVAAEEEEVAASIRCAWPGLRGDEKPLESATLRHRLAMGQAYVCVCLCVRVH